MIIYDIINSTKNERQTKKLYFCNSYKNMARTYIKVDMNNPKTDHQFGLYKMKHIYDLHLKIFSRMKVVPPAFVLHMDWIYTQALGGPWIYTRALGGPWGEKIEEENADDVNDDVNDDMVDQILVLVSNLKSLYLLK